MGSAVASAAAGLYNNRMDDKPIIVISGIPRSGTSLMAQALAAGGVEILTDGARQADESNPRGYFEHEKAKDIAADSAWLIEARGRAVKIMYDQVVYLPDRFRYKVLMMQRPIDEVLASQKAMLARRGEAVASSDESLRRQFLHRLALVVADTIGRPNFEYRYVYYHDLLTMPGPAFEQIEWFLDRPLDVEAMIDAVDVSLYRQRK
jgi:hypothetical protein